MVTKVSLTVFIVLLLSSTPYIRAASEDIVSADALYQELLKSKPAKLPQGLTVSKVVAVTLNDDDKKSQMIGGVQILLEGKVSNPEIRYAIFADAGKADAFSHKFSDRVNNSVQQRLFLPYLPKADCVRTDQAEICAVVSGQSFLMITTPPVPMTQTHDPRPIAGAITPAMLVQPALDHLSAAIAVVAGK